MNKLRSLLTLQRLTHKRHKAHSRLDTLKARRLSAHLTQSELATYVGVDPSTLCRWESGQRIPRSDALIRIDSPLDALNDRTRADEVVPVRLKEWVP